MQLNLLNCAQNYYLTVFSGLFSEFFVKRDTIQSNIQFSTEPARTVYIHVCVSLSRRSVACSNMTCFHTCLQQHDILAHMMTHSQQSVARWLHRMCHTKSAASNVSHDVSSMSCRTIATCIGRHATHSHTHADMPHILNSQHGMIATHTVRFRARWRLRDFSEWVMPP